MTGRKRIASRFGVIADDLTGAMDTGVQFAGRGLSTRVQLTTAPSPSADAVILSTESRQVDTPTAQTRAAAAARLLKGRHIYKKIDSTLRGHVAAEVLAILEALAMVKAVVCPAVMEEGRSVRDGHLWVDDRLLHQTDFASDPDWPARTSDIKEILNAPAQHVSINLVRSEDVELANRFQGISETLIVPDALTEGDLGNIGRAIVASGALPCGALGLAGAWLSASGVFPRKPPMKTKFQLTGLYLIISGSRHPRTVNQIQALGLARDLNIYELPLTSAQNNAQLLDRLEREAEKAKGLVLCSSSHTITSPDERHRMQASLGALTTKLCATHLIGGLIVCGGDTARTVVDALKTQAIEIAGMLQTGFPYGKLVGGAGAGLPIVTKAGGFGTSRSLIQTFDALNAL
jgi:uncharacterized protein YgbK (DUF1537 family)